RRRVARNAARKRKLLEQALQPGFCLRNLAVDFAVGSFEIGVRYEGGAAVSRPRNENHVQFVLLDQPIQENIDEIKSRSRSPMAEKPWLDVFWAEWLAEQWIGIQIDLSNGNEICGTPIRMHFAQFFERKLLL